MLRTAFRLAFRPSPSLASRPASSRSTHSRLFSSRHPDTPLPDESATRESILRDTLEQLDHAKNLEEAGKTNSTRQIYSTDSKWARSCEPLPAPPQPSSRSLLSLAGPGTIKFLQGLTTMDMREWAEGELRTGTFLTTKGRVLADALLWSVKPEEGEETRIIVDSCWTTHKELLEHLNAYKLRRTKVTIQDVSEDLQVTVLHGLPQGVAKPPEQENLLGGAEDPRSRELGFRLLANRVLKEGTEPPFNINTELFPERTGTLDMLRRLLGVPEGKELQGLTPLEANQELAGAVRFDKGCYLGQELTARSFFKGVVRKRSVPAFVVPKDAPVPAGYAAEGGRAPRLSAPQAGAVLWTAGEAGLSGDLVAMESGAKLYDNGKKVGEVLTPPVEGASVAVLQLRLSTVLEGVDPEKVFEVEVGGDGERREVKVLPFVPRWWPEMDLATGKAKKE